MRGSYLSHQAEVVDELPLALSQLVDHLFQTPVIPVPRDGCAAKEAALVPAHILFRNGGGD